MQEEITVHLNTFMRQSHRWLSIAFTLMAGAIFLALGLGQEPASWVYFLPLLPLALMALTGLYMFFLPYTAKHRQRVGA
jgi:hypothetical protein